MSKRKYQETSLVSTAFLNNNDRKQHQEIISFASLSFSFDNKLLCVLCNRNIHELKESSPSYLWFCDRAISHIYVCSSCKKKGNSLYQTCRICLLSVLPQKIDEYFSGWIGLRHSICWSCMDDIPNHQDLCLSCHEKLHIFLHILFPETIILHIIRPYTRKFIQV